MNVRFAKTPEHAEFLRTFEGQIKGRYIIAVLVGIGVLGGAELRAEVERQLGHASFTPDQMYPASEYVLACDRAARAGLSFVRIGELIFPAYRRAHPELFEGRTVFDAFKLLEHAYRTETTWGGMSAPMALDGRHATFYRRSQPAPCEMGKGVLLGVLRAFDATGTVEETACQWEGAEACRLDVVLDPLPAG
jgi:hypothetical protein